MTGTGLRSGSRDLGKVVRRGEEVKLEEVKLGEERGRWSACLLDWGWVDGLDDIEVGDCRSGSGLN